MLQQRLVWGGTMIVSVVGIYLAAVQVSAQIPKIAVIVIGVAVGLAAVLLFPYTSNNSGNPVSLFNSLQARGKRNRTQIAGDRSQQIISDGDVNIQRNDIR